MRAGRALLRTLRRRRPDRDAGVRTVFWGRIGEYEAVSRQGVLFLLSPEATHPSRRVAEPAQSPLTTPGTRMVS